MEPLSIESKIFEAKTLEIAYEMATSHFNSSITSLNINLIQAPKQGFFGLFSKNTIIEVSTKASNKHRKKDNITQTKPIINNQKEPVKKINKKKQDNIMFDDFYNKDIQTEQDHKIILKNEDKCNIDEISLEINKLFANSCYDLDLINVSLYDETTLYIEFNGADAALLIGKEGYRYKALSYILFNWIHAKYNYMIRLEVASFLKTQEESIHVYLEPIIQTIKDNGFCKTKPLDGLLLHIALEKLRDLFPDKYVAIKTNIKGDKYILVNEYRK